MANNRVQVKRTSTTGRTPNTTGSYATNSQYISAGELALNMTDGILFSSNGSALIEIGSNNTNQRITNSLTIDNNKNLRFTTVNTSAVVSFIQQNDDNFVMYSTNTAYGQRAIWSVYANSISNLQIQVPLQLNAGLVANGGLGSAGQVLTSNGTTTYWSTVSGGGGSVNTAAQYTWTNTHTFQANVSFTGNGIGLTTNTAAIYLGGLADNNWKIGRNTGSTTKWRYTNNSIDIITANSNLEGFAIGLISGNSYFETGYLGTFIAANVTIGNSSSNSTINSTAFSGSANNTTYVNGKTEGNLNVNSATQATNATNLNSQPSSFYTNATNITTGTLPYAQIPANIINTTAAFTISGIHTYNANIVLGSSGLSANGSFGTAGHVLHSNGTATYWAADDNAGGTVTSVATGSGLSGGPITTTGTVSVLANNGITANTNGVFVTQGTGTVVNATGVHVNSTYIGTLSANNASFLGGTAAASYQLNSTLNANIASYLPTYTGVVNGSSHTVGSSFIANATGVYHTGTMNAASHTVGTSTIANATGVYTGIVNATTISTGSVNVINASGLTTTANVSIGAAGDLIIAAGAGISANGGFGTSGQVLTSNASSIYWSTIAAGATLNANNTETGTFYFGMANTTSGTWSNAVVSTTKISFVPNTGALTVNGSISATTKSFLIDHPTKSGMKLRYASLEGPENGVYIRGKINGYVIGLPEYWTGLVDEDTITVQLTAIGEPQTLYIVEVSDNQVFINSKEGVPYCYYTVYGERKDVDKLIVEY